MNSPCSLSIHLMLIPWWIPYFNYYEKCCCKCGAAVSVIQSVFAVYTQKWDCWIMWQTVSTFWSYLYAAFHSDCTNLHTPSNSTSQSPHPGQHLLLLVSWILTFLKGVRWHLTVVLIYIPWWLVMLTIFYIFVGHFYFFFRDLYVEVICPFMSWIGCFVVEISE